MAEGDFNVKAIISAETSNFDKGLKNAQSSVDSLSKSIEGISKMLKTAFSVVGITASVGAITNFGKKAVSAADEANKRFKILQNTVKATGASTWTSAEDLDKMAKSYAKSTDYAVSEVEKMQSVLLGFRNITGETFEQASDAIMDMATVMGMDLTSAVQTVGKALDDPVKGLDSLRRQGFQFTDEQKEELKILVANGKQLEAQKIILEELATTYGGAAKAGQSAFSRLRHTMDEFKENLGNKLMPVVNMVMNQMAKSVENITRVINNVDLNHIIGIVINIANKIKSVLDSISQYFDKTFGGIKSTIKSMDLSPLISVLDTTIGALKKIIDEFKIKINEAVRMFTSLKDGFSNVIDLKKIADVVNTAIDIYWFLRDQIVEIQKSINDLKIQIFNSIVSIFKKSNEVLAENEKGFASWSEFIWDQVNNVFRIFQDLFGMINQLIKGNWAAAWEYAKLAFMRVADVILNLFSQIANAFPNLINGIIDGLNNLIKQINKVRSWLGQEEWDLLKPFESVDLSESSGLNAKIVEAEKKIAELTGKQADYAINEIKRVSTASKGFTTNLINDITDTTDLVIDSSNRAAYTVTSNLNTEASEGSQTYKKLSEWEKKLLQQKQADAREWSRDYHQATITLLKDEKETALSTAKTEKERADIKKYYNKEIEKENKRYVKAIISHYSEMVSKVTSMITNMLKKLSSTVISGLKTLFGGIKNITDISINDSLDTLLKFEDAILTFFVETLPRMPEFVKSALQSIAVLFQNLKETVNPETLSSLVQDIVSTLMSNLPGIIADLMDVGSAIVSGLTDGLVKTLNPEILSSFVQDIILTLTSNLPSIIRDLMSVGTNIILGLVDGFTKTMPNIFKALNEIKDSIMDSIRTIIPAIVPFVGELLKNGIPLLVDTIFDIADIVFENFPAIVNELVEALPVLVQAIVDNLPRFFEESLPKLIKGIVDLIPTIFSSTGKLIKGIIEAIPIIITAIIKGLVDMLSNLNAEKIAEIITAIIKMVGDIAAGIINSIGLIISKLLPAMVELVIELIKKLPEILVGVFKGTVEGIGQLATAVWDGIKSAGKAIGGFFKNLFTGKLFASGTDNAPRGLAIVGEKGPELVNFRGGEQVLSNSNTQRALAGMGNSNNFSVVFNNTKDTTAYTLMRELKQYNRQMAINGII